MDTAIKEKDGRFSSRKIAGLTVVAVSIAMALIDQLTDHKANVVLWTTMFSSGMVMLGFKNIKIFNK